MKKRIIGKDLTVSAVGLGCMGMSHAYGNQCTPDEAKNLIETAIENGCTFFVYVDKNPQAKDLLWFVRLGEL